MLRGEYHDSFPIDLMCKDNQLGYEMAREAKVRVRQKSKETSMDWWLEDTSILSTDAIKPEVKFPPRSVRRVTARYAVGQKLEVKPVIHPLAI